MNMGNPPTVDREWGHVHRVTERLDVGSTSGRMVPGSSVHGVFQARELEWVAIAFSIL